MNTSFAHISILFIIFILVQLKCLGDICVGYHIEILLHASNFSILLTMYICKYILKSIYPYVCTYVICVCLQTNTYFVSIFCMYTGMCCVRTDVSMYIQGHYSLGLSQGTGGDNLTITVNNRMS